MQKKIINPIPTTNRLRNKRQVMKAYLVFIMIFAGITTAFASPCPINEYQNKLSSIGFKDITSVNQAADALIKQSKNQEEKCKTELLFVFRQYYLSCLNEYNDMIDTSKINNTSEKQFNKLLSKIGWGVKLSEGNYYIGESAGWFEAKFKNILTEPYKEYLHYRSKEIREGFSEDAGLLISWNQLGDRIITWEAFLKKYPNFPEKQMIESYLDSYIRVFLSGMDNSPIHNFENMTLDKDVRAAYEKFIKDNKTSKYYKLVKDYYEMIKKNNFLLPNDYEKYLERKGFKSYLAVQPPTY